MSPIVEKLDLYFFLFSSSTLGRFLVCRLLGTSNSRKVLARVCFFASDPVQGYFFLSSSYLYERTPNRD